MGPAHPTPSNPHKSSTKFRPTPPLRFYPRLKLRNPRNTPPCFFWSPVSFWGTIYMEAALLSLTLLIRSMNTLPPPLSLEDLGPPCVVHFFMLQTTHVDIHA
jgi:hypothetical protein